MRKSTWSLTLHEAINIGLDNSEIDSRHVPKRNARQDRSLEADADPERFKSELMAHLRSIEQLYWSLVSGSRATLGGGSGRPDWRKRFSSASRQN